MANREHGTVVSIHRVAKRNAPAEAIEQTELVTDRGIPGDFRSRAGRGRQVTLVEAEALEAVAAALGLGAIPPGASRRQIVVRGFALDGTVGRRLRLGDAVLEVHDLCDPCANMEDKIGPGAFRAMANRGGICARVLRGGTVRVGDSIAELEPSE